MEQYQAKGICPGIAIGTLQVVSTAQFQSKEVGQEKLAASMQLARYEAAKKLVLSDLDGLSKQAQVLGEAQAFLFESHKMLLCDDAFDGAITRALLEEQKSSEEAVAQVGEALGKQVAAMPDPVMQAKEADVRDITGQLLAALGAAKKSSFAWQEPVILVAEELTPSQMMALPKDSILALVTIQGSAYSHTAILAKAMGIPTLVGVPINTKDLETLQGRFAMVDGEAGRFVVEPEEEVLAGAKQKKVTDEPGMATQQIPIRMLANVGSLEEVDQALAMGAEGIGLFRSEFLFLERNTCPSEEEQFAIYKATLQRMAGKRVVIRTLDLGADKQCAYLSLPREENPAMGLRGIRLCLARPEIFLPQLRALLRAAAYGDLSVMYPMISDVSELRRVKALVEQAKDSLQAEGVPFGSFKQGCMIETPAAVMSCQELMQEVDFLSIGTNDLTQYTLGVDRQNGALDGLYDDHHPAVLRMIEVVVEEAKTAGIPVCICGELGSDSAMAGWFLEKGMDALSMAPGCISSMRRAILACK